MFGFKREWVGIALLGSLGAWACGDGDRAGGGVEFTERSREAANGGDAAHLDWLRANYDKSEHMVPMRDGVELYTIVYTPRFAADPVPVMLFRTPYSIAPYEPGEYRNPLGPSAEFDRAGYVFVFQDVRGKFRSEGDFEVIRPLAQKPKGPATVDESTDNYDAIEWALANLEGHNGRAGQWGISYPGWQTVMGMVDAHPALAASSPQASPSDMFIGDDWHHNGAFRVMYAFSWLARNARRRDAPTDVRPGGFDYGTDSGYDFFLEAGSAVEHRRALLSRRCPRLERFHRARHLRRLLAAAERAPSSSQHRAPDPERGRLVRHRGLLRPDVDLPNHRGKEPRHGKHPGGGPVAARRLVPHARRPPGMHRVRRRDLRDLPARRSASVLRAPPAGRRQLDRARGVSSSRPEPTRGGSHDRWPPANIEQVPLYLAENGALSFVAPGPPGGSDSYTSDASDPVPFSAEERTTLGHLWKVEDQRFASARPDVLVYQSPALQEDLTIAGPILADIFVSTTGTDSDWIVKVIDVYPDDAPDSPFCDVPMGGYQMHLAGEIMRGRFRKSLENPEPMVPGEVTPIHIDLRDRYHTFKAGHRIMVHVQSSWFPAYDRNTQQFVDTYRATPGQYVAAEQTVYRGADRPSRVTFGVVR